MPLLSPPLPQIFDAAIFFAPLLALLIVCHAMLIIIDIFADFHFFQRYAAIDAADYA
jgi:hypothetical protein